jgi:hypothetical protein
MRRKDWPGLVRENETWLSYEQPDWTLEQSSQALYAITTILAEVLVLFQLVGAAFEALAHHRA